MTLHMPECYLSGSPNLCPMCEALRVCEQRVRMEDDDYAYVAAQAEADGRRRGWNEALDAAREAVKNVPCPEGYEAKGCSHWDDALAAIDALREWPDPPLLPPSVGVPSTPMWPLRGES